MLTEVLTTWLLTALLVAMVAALFELQRMPWRSSRSTWLSALVARCFEEQRILFDAAQSVEECDAVLIDETEVQRVPPTLKPRADARPRTARGPPRAVPRERA